MTDEEHEMIKEVHEFWFKPPVRGKPTRAQRIDDLLQAVNTGKISVRALLWIAGSLVAVSAAFQHVQGWFK